MCLSRIEEYRRYLKPWCSYVNTNHFLLKSGERIHPLAGAATSVQDQSSSLIERQLPQSRLMELEAPPQFKKCLIPIIIRNSVSQLASTRISIDNVSCDTGFDEALNS